MVEQLTVNQLVTGSSPVPGAKLYVRRLLLRDFVARLACEARKGLTLKGFATLRVAQKTIPVPAKFDSLLRSNRIPLCGIANLFYFRLWRKGKAIILIQKRYY